MCSPTSSHACESPAPHPAPPRTATGARRRYRQRGGRTAHWARGQPSSPGSFAGSRSPGEGTPQSLPHRTFGRTASGWRPPLTPCPTVPAPTMGRRGGQWPCGECTPRREKRQPAPPLSGSGNTLHPRGSVWWHCGLCVSRWTQRDGHGVHDARTGVQALPLPELEACLRLTGAPTRGVTQSLRCFAPLAWKKRRSGVPQRSKWGAGLRRLGVRASLLVPAQGAKFPPKIGLIIGDDRMITLLLMIASSRLAINGRATRPGDAAAARVCQCLLVVLGCSTRVSSQSSDALTVRCRTHGLHVCRGDCTRIADGVASLGRHGQR